MSVSGRFYAEETLSQKIDDWCASHVRCFKEMGWCRSWRYRTSALVYVISSGALALLVACDGTMQGVVRGEGTRVMFKYEQGMDRDFYGAIVDGENFEGQAIHADAKSGVGIGFSDGTTVPVITFSTSGNMVAVMFGNKGSTMRCNMNYADSSGFTPMGGVGICMHSDGRIIDVMW
jgi:hypothetical protein